jgi:alpha-mannosidase
MHYLRQLVRKGLAALIIITIGGASQMMQSQTRESIDQNLAALSAVAGCLEGYAGAAEGQAIEYPRIRPEYPQALLTRTTTGAMAIAWRTSPVPPEQNSNGCSFVVRAGIQSQPGITRNFEVFVNDVSRFVITTTEKGTWSVQGKQGGSLTFTAIMRDQFNDAFGLLRFNLPAEWVTPGRPVRIRIVGEKAGASTWLLVYEDTDIISYLRNKAENEAYCDLTIASRGTSISVAARGSSNLVGKPLVCETVSGETSRSEFSLDSAHASAMSTYKSRNGLPARFVIDGVAAPLPQDLKPDTAVSRILLSRLISIRTRQTGLGTWKVEYTSIYTPSLGSSLVELSETCRGAGELYQVSSSHQDIAWMDSPQQCMIDRDQKVITPALELMGREKDFCFDLEDMLEVREYVARHPDRKDLLTQYFREGRLGVGATYTMPYEDILSGEALVHQLYAGRKWFRKNFPGCDTHVAWNPDVPGRTMQSPQIMKKSGVDYLIISRHAKGAFDWRSPDGTAILTFSPGHYGLFQERTLGKPFYEVGAFLASSSVEWSTKVLPGSKSIPVFSMSDMSAPISFKNMMGTWNTLRSIERPNGTEQPIVLPLWRYATAQQYMTAAARESLRQPDVIGERPNIWLYIHGPTHHWAISAKREADVLLPAAETFATIDAILAGSFAAYPQKRLTDAWESLVYPDHGWGGKNGEITDSLFLRKYQSARDAGKEIQERSITAIAGRVKTLQTKGTPLVVFNALSWKRTGPVQTTLSFASGKIREGFAIRTAAGKAVPFQVIRQEHHPDGSIQSAEIVFVASEVPATGYATFYVVPDGNVATPASDSHPAPSMLENRFYALTLGQGGVTQIRDKELRKDLFRTGKFLGGELFTMQSVGEDAGEWAEPQQPTMEGFERLAETPGAWTLVEAGPVRQVVESRHKTAHATVVSRVVLYAGLKQVEFETSLLQWDGTKYREFRLAFPVNVERGEVSYEVPFGTLRVGKDEMKGAAGERYTEEVALVRPRSIMNWIGVDDSTFGVTIGSSVQVWDYADPTSNPMPGPLLQPVLLASRRSCHGEGPWYLQKGDHQYRFVLTSHKSGEGRRFGVSSNTPLTAVFNAPGQQRRTLPESHSFFDTGSDHVVLSTMKKGEDDESVVVRLYEADGTDAAASLSIPFAPTAMEKTNMIEEEGVRMDLPASGHKQIPIGMPHHSVETFKFFTWPSRN